jgi:hypothetical protein
MPNELNHNIYREYEGETLNAVLIVADIRRVVPFTISSDMNVL